MKLLLPLVIFIIFSSKLFANEPTFEDLNFAIAQEKICDQSGMLAWLSKNYPTYMMNFTLMRTSRSLQAATPTAPRVIVFGESAQMILTFTGSDAQEGGRAFEVMQFRTAPAAHWEFREIEFAGCDEPVKVSTANPAKCARCHGSQGNPIWEDYDFWDGAYGENDDGVLDYDQHYPHIDLKGKKFDRSRAVLAEFRTWQKLQPEHPRYQHLQFDPRNDSSTAPYSDFEPRAQPYYKRPNLRLTKAIAALQGRVIASRMQNYNAACYATIAPLMVAKFSNCYSDDGAVAESIAKFTELLQDNKAAFDQYFANYDDHNHRWEYYPQRVDRISVPTLLVRLLGIDQRDWNIAYNPSNWNYRTGTIDMTTEVMHAVYDDLYDPKTMAPYQAFLARNHSAYYNYSAPATEQDYYELDFDQYPGSGRPEYSEGSVPTACKQLTQKVPEWQQIAANCLQTKPEAIKAGSESIFRMCGSCHSAPGVPEIPFANQLQLPAWREHILDRIRQDGGSAMPPERGLNRQEKFIVEQLFKAAD